MLPGQLNLTLVQGATFRYELTWKRPPAPGAAAVPLDLTGWSASAVVVIAGTEALAFDSDPAAAAAGAINLGGPDGTIGLVMPADAIAAARGGEGDWALYMVDPAGEPDVLLMGRAAIVRGPGGA